MYWFGYAIAVVVIFPWIAVRHSPRYNFDRRLECLVMTAVVALFWPLILGFMALRWEFRRRMAHRRRPPGRAVYGGPAQYGTRAMYGGGQTSGG